MKSFLVLALAGVQLAHAEAGTQSSHLRAPVTRLGAALEQHDTPPSVQYQFSPLKQADHLKQTPVDKAPLKKSVDKAPLKKSVEKAPLKKSVEKAPLKQTPVEKAPLKKSVEKAPLKQTPVDKAPLKKSVENAPLKQTPVKKAPLKQTPVKKAPLKHVTSPETSANPSLRHVSAPPKVLESPKKVLESPKKALKSPKNVVLQNASPDGDATRGWASGTVVGVSGGGVVLAGLLATVLGNGTKKKKMESSSGLDSGQPSEETGLLESTKINF